jgi:molybdopterin converting factor small subunit
MSSVKNSHPEIYQRWCDADGKLRETLTMFVNGDHIRYRNGLETVVEAGDEIYIVPLIAGGVMAAETNISGCHGGLAFLPAFSIAPNVTYR